MRLGVALPYGQGDMAPEDVTEFVKAADDLGYHSVWMAEAWSFDAFQVLTSLIPHTKQIGLATGIVNVYSRTPALLGQSAATLDALSGGRAVLGIGASGPQVIEGWHGLPYEKPVQRTRETIEIVRTILRRERLNYSGKVFDLQMGLKLINHPIRPDVPIYVASLGPKNVEMTAELAVGWNPVLYLPSKAKEIWGDSLEAGKAKRSEDLPDLDVMPAFTVCVTDDPAGPREFAKFPLALYIGGMGSKQHNFYNRLVRRYGYEKEAEEIQDLYLAKKHDEARAKVPEELVEQLTAIGPEGYVKDRLAEFAESGATGLLCQVMGFDQPHRIKILETLSKLA